MSTHRIVLDADVGIDDAIAILYLAGLPEVELVAVGSVHGNCNGEVAAYNALRVLERCGLSSVPVAIGALRPVAGETTFAPYVHGYDGLGDLGLPPPYGRPTDERADDQLIRLAREQPGELDLLAIGPLTNLSLALRKDPDVLSRYRSVTIMGGSGPYPAAGVMLEVDANILNDPQGADEVFAAPRRLLTMVGVNVTSPTILDEAGIEQLRASSVPQARFAWEILQCYLDFYGTYWARRICSVHDPLAAAICVDPSFVTGYRDGPAAVVRSATSYRAFLAPGGASEAATQRPPTRVVTEVDRPRFIAHLLATLTDPAYPGSGRA